MKPSRFQSDIYARYESTNDNLSLCAVAGSGKSTTLAELVKRTPWEQSILVMAFNKDIVKDLTPRMASHPMCQVRTFNSFGNSIVRANMRVGQIDEFKADNCLRSHVDKDLFYRYKNSNKRLLDLFRANLMMESMTDSCILDTLEEYSIEVPVKKDSEIPIYCEAIRQSYTACLSNGSFDFRDQVFLPIFHDFPIPKFDVVFVDEDQDLDRNQAELVIRAARRLIMVGDPEQAIYRFRGAMADAVTELEGVTRAVRMPLSVCYRCPTDIISLAKEIVPGIEACDWAPKGNIQTLKNGEFHTTVQDGNLVLCRCVLPLVSNCLALIRLGKNARIRGRDIAEQLKTLVTKIGGTSIADFKIALDEYASKQRERLSRLNKEQQLIQLEDTVSTILVIAESCDLVKDILYKIDSIFTDAAITGIQMMTIHKAKGLENPKVFILAPELLPHPRAKKDVDRKTEMNLKYVAVTRVKFTVEEPGTLYWVKS